MEGFASFSLKGANGKTENKTADIVANGFTFGGFSSSLPGKTPAQTSGIGTAKVMGKPFNFPTPVGAGSPGTKPVGASFAAPLPSAAPPAHVPAGAPLVIGGVKGLTGFKAGAGTGGIPGLVAKTSGSPFNFSAPLHTGSPDTKPVGASFATPLPSAAPPAHVPAGAPLVIGGVRGLTGFKAGAGTGGIPGLVEKTSGSPFNFSAPLSAKAPTPDSGQSKLPNHAGSSSTNAVDPTISDKLSSATTTSAVNLPAQTGKLPLQPGLASGEDRKRSEKAKDQDCGEAGDLDAEDLLAMRLNETSDDLGERVQSLLMSAQPGIIAGSVSPAESVSLLAVCPLTGNVVALAAGNRLVYATARDISATGGDAEGRKFRPLRLYGGAIPGGTSMDVLSSSARLTSLKFDPLLGSSLLVSGPKNIFVVRLDMGGEDGGDDDTAGMRGMVVVNENSSNLLSRCLEGGALVGVEWHPLSHNRVVALGTTNLTLLKIRDAGSAAPSNADGGLSVECGVDLSGLASPAASLCFGSRSGWQLFACFVLLESGAVHSVCPLLPNGRSLVRRREVAELMESTSEELLLAQAVSSNCQNLASSTASSTASLTSLGRRLAWLEKCFGPYPQLLRQQPRPQTSVTTPHTPCKDKDSMMTAFSRLGIASSASHGLTSPTVTSTRAPSHLFSTPSVAASPFSPSVRFSSSSSSSSFSASASGYSSSSSSAVPGDGKVDFDGDDLEEEVAMVVQRGGDQEADDTLSSFRVVVNPTPLLLSRDHPPSPPSTKSAGVGAARALCNVTAAPSLSRSSAAAFPVLATAFANGRVEVNVACGEVQPVWCGNLSQDDDAARRGRLPAWRSLFEDAIENIYEVPSMCAEKGHLITVLSLLPELRNRARLELGLFPSFAFLGSATAARASNTTDQRRAAAEEQERTEARTLRIFLNSTLLPGKPENAVVDLAAFASFLSKHSPSSAGEDRQPVSSLFAVLVRKTGGASSGLLNRAALRDFLLARTDENDDGGGGDESGVACLIRLAEAMGIPTLAFNSSREGDGELLATQTLFNAVAALLHEAAGYAVLPHKRVAPSCSAPWSARGLMGEAVMGEETFHALLSWSLALETVKWHDLALALLGNTAMPPGQHGAAVDLIASTPVGRRAMRVCLCARPVDRPSVVALASLLGVKDRLPALLEAPARGEASYSAGGGDEEARAVFDTARDLMSRYFQTVSKSSVTLKELITNAFHLNRTFVFPALGRATENQPVPSSPPPPPSTSTTPQLLLGRYEFGYSGGGAPRIMVDPWGAFPPSLIVAHSSVAVAVKVNGLDRLEGDLNDDHLEVHQAEEEAAGGGGTATRLSWRHRLQSSLSVAAELLCGFGSLPSGTTPAVPGLQGQSSARILRSGGLVGCQALSTPSLGSLLLFWFAQGSAAVVNFSVLNARLSSNSMPRNMAMQPSTNLRTGSESGDSGAMEAFFEKAGGQPMALKARALIKTICGALARCPETLINTSTGQSKEEQEQRQSEVTPLLKELKVCMDHLESARLTLASHRVTQRSLLSEVRQLASVQVAAAARQAEDKAARCGMRVARLRARNEASRRKANGLLRITVGASPSTSAAETVYLHELRRMLLQVRSEWPAQLVAVKHKKEQCEAKKQKEQENSRLGRMPPQGLSGELIFVGENEWEITNGVMRDTQEVLAEASEKATSLRGRLQARRELPPPAPPSFFATSPTSPNATNSERAPGSATSPPVGLSPSRMSSLGMSPNVLIGSPSPNTPSLSNLSSSPFQAEGPYQPNTQAPLSTYTMSPSSSSLNMASVMDILGEIDVSTPLRKTNRRRGYR